MRLNMLSVNINQDVEQYQETVIAGLNGKQAIAVLLALAAGTAVVCGLYMGLGVPLEIAVYIAIPVCTPFILSVFGSRYGLSTTERIHGNNKRKQVLLYDAKRNMAESVEKKTEHRQRRSGKACAKRQIRKSKKDAEEQTDFCE